MLPAAGAVAVAVVVAAFSLPFINDTGPFAGLEDNAENIFSLAYGFAFYFAICTVATFFNVALIHCILRRLAGEDCSAGDGLRHAVARLPQIVGWSAIAATVGLLLRVLQERFEGLGELLFGLVGVAWSIASFFVVPVLVVEGTGPITAIKRSSALMRHTWGASLAANFGVSVLMVIAVMVGVLLILVLAGLLPEAAFYTAAIAISIVVALAIFLLVTLSTVLKAALYQYASTGDVPGEYDRATFESAFRK
ncbi:MAG: hypothetical protein AcusKO_22790 [Acuticoccus sp.]